MIYRRLLIIIFISVYYCYGEDKVVDGLFAGIRIKVENRKDSIADVAYLNAYLREKNIIQDTMDRTLRFVDSYGDKDLALYFLLLECNQRDLVKRMFEKDSVSNNYRHIKNADLIKGILASFFEVNYPESDDEDILDDGHKNYPFDILLGIECITSTTYKANITITNKSSSGRFFIDSPDLMDYIRIQRIDGIDIPPMTHRTPTVPVFLNSGDTISKNGFLKVDIMSSYTVDLRESYPSDVAGYATPISFFTDLNIPCISINRKIISFGTNSIPLIVSAIYDENYLFQRLIVNNFDSNRMPWVKSKAEKLIENSIFNRFGIHDDPRKEMYDIDWYTELLSISSLPEIIK